MTDTGARIYTGQGGERVSPMLEGAWDRAEPYLAPESLVHAVNMAIYLRRPLLLEGEPGCGKTRLAYSIAYELGLPLIEIYIRSTSRAQDLLYTFDAVRRLYDIQERAATAARTLGADATTGPTGASGAPISAPDGANGATRANHADLRPYVRLGELGEAITRAERGTPSVVLIDEIDKADIDFPNDLLLVLDRLQFSVAEVPGWRVDALHGQEREERRDVLPILIITSNREKELPAPFLRRCLFYYIDFPAQADLERIVARHFDRTLSPLFNAALRKFLRLRAQDVFRWRKLPSTSELLDWMRMLEHDEQAGRLDAVTLDTTPLPRLPHLEALVKTQSDLEGVSKLPPEDLPAHA